MLKDLTQVEYHPLAEQIVKTIAQKTQSNNHLFSHVMVSYFFAKLASMMRANIDTPDRGAIPINLYAINLATSGQGKGHSMNIIEEQIINQFKDRFLDETFQFQADKQLVKLANKRSVRNGTDQKDELDALDKEFKGMGKLLFSFDSATTAAVKQMRDQLLYADAGSINMEIDEIGSNLLGQVDVLTMFLELFDVGKLKQKLIKNTKENVRNEPIDGRTPANILLFGTPSKLLDGGKTEDEFFSMLETGYARRCLFGYSKTNHRSYEYTPEELYDLMTDTNTDQFLEDTATKFGKLANPLNFNKNIKLLKDVALQLLEYKIECEKLANDMPEHDEIRKAEMQHRYFKALKLAGAYAFIDESPEITEDHLWSAIKLVEDSGNALDDLLTRDRNYVKLAKYIAEVGTEVTKVDLVEDLPFFNSGIQKQTELMQLAIAYGYKNNIVIKRIFNDGIEFLKGESLQETDLDRMVVSYGTQLAENYKNDFAKFTDLHKLTQQQGFHWVAHHLKGGYRKEDNAIPGFNLVVLDIDGTVSMDTVRLLMKDYKYLLYTTKRHDANKHRFRLILPLSHTLQLDAREYKLFMQNIYEWLPFELDEQTAQRARKWMSHNGSHEYNDGEPLDALLFIPRTTKSEERRQFISDTQSLSNMERWFMNNTGQGNRSNQLIKYALFLVDAGQDIQTIQNNVLALNSKLPEKLEEAEILTTILVTAGKAIHKRDTQS